ncbi:MAG: Crp/Fnr family transcriptional regulator [Candidatus Competibacteraceae bacterium]|nr:Crp/Fnr family transcriptional regulator [Candidatus Competibacteraceae bacterium]
MVEQRRPIRGDDCIECRLRQQNEWRVLESEEIKVLAQSQKCRLYQAGEAVFSEGEPSHGIYCINSGTVAIRKINSGGNAVLVQLAYPGDTLGYRGLLLGGNRCASAEALGASKICFIHRDAVCALLDRNPALGLQFLRRINADLDDAHAKLVQNATFSNRTKFVHLLLVLMNRHGRTANDGSRVMQLPLSRRDMASMIGARHETLSRIISRLQEDGIARFSGRTVHVTQPNSLVDEIRPMTLG